MSQVFTGNFRVLLLEGLLSGDRGVDSLLSSGSVVDLRLCSELFSFSGFIEQAIFESMNLTAMDLVVQINGSSHLVSLNVQLSIVDISFNGSLVGFTMSDSFP